jgi:beta-lactamase class A
MRYAIAALLACSITLGATAQDDAKRQLLAELARISDSTGGKLGVGAVAVKTGERISLHGGDRFPMASTYKVPIAMTVLDRVDHGTLKLAQEVPIDAFNLSPGSAELATEPEVDKASSVEKLVELMIRNSDNTATDHPLRLVGGPAAVTKHMRALGIKDLDVSRPTAEIVAASWGYKLPPPGERTRRNISQAIATTPQATREESARRFLADLKDPKRARDTTTPDAMATALERLASGKALSPSSTALLVDHMENCRTGAHRMRYELPRGTMVAHKTGTLTRVTTNDVGIIRLPYGKGALAVALFVTGSPQPLSAQEDALAMASRALYRYYTR